MHETQGKCLGKQDISYGIKEVTNNLRSNMTRKCTQKQIVKNGCVLSQVVTEPNIQ